ncbi:MAG: LysM peptidoglycan-binding domain-containing protein [Actinomycetes bacterium]
MAAVRSTPIRTARTATSNPRATRSFRVVGATALAPEHPRPTEIAPRRAGSTPPRLRLVSTVPRPAPVVRPRPTAAVYRRRRIGVVVAATALALVVAQAATALGGDSLASPERRPAAVTVQAGDSLWSIAERVAPGEDPRPIVDRLQARLGSTVLQPGQRIVLGD